MRLHIMRSAPQPFAHLRDDGDVLLDCQRYMNCWFGVVKVRDQAQTRIVHVCTQLRGSANSALDDARRDAQNIAPMFAQ